ncbi:B12-binding domain-containing radical SAM protein [Candidatus Undinarchaeota archaeon]
MKVIVLNPSTKKTSNVARDLIYGCWCAGKRIANATFPPLNLVYIATVLKDDGHDVLLYDAQALGLSVEEQLDFIKNRKPDILIISTSSMSFGEDIKILEYVKKCCDAKTVIFGSHITFMPEKCMQSDAIDFGIMREPEFAIRDLLRNIKKGKWEKSKGIVYMKKRKVIVNPPYPYIKNLDELPFPDRSMLPDVSFFNPLITRFPWTTILTSRGCPAKCIFCTVPYFYGGKWRSRSIDNIMVELRALVADGYKEIFFRDETFTAQRKKVQELCKKIIEEKLEFKWIANGRVGNLDKETMQLMKKAGCEMLKFGVESGVQEILDNIRKGIQVEKTRETFKWTNEVGIKTHAHFMLGCVGETKDTIEKTIQFAKEIRPTTVTFGIFTPYPGTPLFKMVQEKIGKEKEITYDLGTVHVQTYYNELFTDLPSEELQKYVSIAYRKFYLRPGYVLHRLKEVKSPTHLIQLIKSGFAVLTFIGSSE